MKFNSILILLLATNAFAAETRTVEYTFLTIGKPSGAQTVVYQSDGTTKISFNFNDRGRGPETETSIALNDAGVPIAVAITGKNYRKGAVNERFSVLGETASWKSIIESGNAPFDGKTFYLANNAAPEMMAILARAILNSERGVVDLLPTGQATISELATSTLIDGDKSKQVTLYGISGLDTNPTHVWLDESQQFFGADHGWFGLTLEGYEHHIDTLKAVQSDATDAHFETAAVDLTTRIEGLLVVKNARLFDSLSGNLTVPATVFVWDGKVSAIYFEEAPIPEGAAVIEAEGQTLLPTLWDMHGHVNVSNYLNYLASGVTNVRDMANDENAIEKLSNDVRVGKIAGPDIYALGFIDKRGEFAAPTGRLIDTLDEGMSFIDFYSQHGYYGIKLYSSIEPEWVRPLAEYAHARGLVVKGHVPAYMNAEQAINAGYDEITHINMILLNFLGAETLDTRTPTRFKVPGELAGDIDLASDEVQAFIALMKQKNVAHDPTLGIFINMFRNEPGKISPTFRDIADHLPANTRRQTIAATGFNDGKEEIYRRAAERSLELTRLLHESGIRILPGTDNMLPGFSLIRELIYYTEAGIPANEVLQLATIVSARHLHQEQRLGSISVGKDAHMFLVEGNPLENIADLYKVRHVIKGRQLYFAPDILKSLGFVPF